MTGARLKGGGLVALVAEGGGLASLATESLELVQHAASSFEPGLLQVWVRDRGAGACWPVLGAGSGSRVRVDDDALVLDGGAGTLRWRVTFALHPERSAWAWHVEVANDGDIPRDVDVVHAHDLALADPRALRANELYVSQYLDVSPLDVATGTALAIRQNEPQGGGRHPWCVVAADRDVVAWNTDALSVYGLSGRRGDPIGPRADLPARRLQHEHTLATLQVAPARLGPVDELRVTFAGLLVADHPAATGPDDEALAAEALDLARATRPWGDEVPAPEGAGVPAPSGPYDRGRELGVRPLAEGELAVRWPGPWRLVERDDDGTLLSFFAGTEHVVTRAKEVAVLRPHGTILRTGDRAAPDPDGLTATAWMAGSPLSYLTRGHATAGRVLTTVRGYLGLHRAYGLRVFAEVGGGWRLLDLPSAFAMTPDAARWVYAFDAADDDPGGAIELHTAMPAADRRAEVTVDVVGQPRRLLVALHRAGCDDPLPPPPGTVDTEATLDGVVVRRVGPTGRQALAVGASSPVTVGDDAALFDDGEAREGGVVSLVTDPLSRLVLDVRVTDGDVPGAPAPTGATRRDGEDPWWPGVTAVHVLGSPEVEALDASLPWLVRDAFVHYLSPRGLEQYTGGAWGTRDVTQGPLELLLALDRLADARALVLRVFAAQNDDGSWPQSFGFMPGYEGYRDEPPHGDVVHWPVLALGRYLLASGDVGVLGEPVPWHAADATPVALLDHALAALDRARADVLPGTHLVAYGEGDWNDSLQPADPQAARTMTSTWTVTLHHQALRTLANGLAVAGGSDALAAALREEAALVSADLHRYLLVDGELAGYVQLSGADDGPGRHRTEADAPTATRYLVHPRDERTGLRHGAIHVIHALLEDLLDPAEATHHADLVRRHLTGVDGVRLFDRPPGYRGGATRDFRRAETATFVGREIGLMYVHAHLRWCEAMARLGDAEALWLGLRQVLQPAVPDVVPGARRRQANTYASSSDAAVLDRAEFAARYDEVLTGATGFEAGWRIYSSGPGVLVRIVVQCLLGVRRRGSAVELDPVLPTRLDGLSAVVPLAGGLLKLRFRVGPRGCGVVGLRVDGRPVAARRTGNPYRPGGVSVRLADLAGALEPGGPDVEVDVA